MANEPGREQGSEEAHSARGVAMVLLPCCLAFFFLISGESVTISLEEAAQPTFTLALVGDLMLGRGVAEALDGDWELAFAQVRPWLAEADLAFANLESPLTTAPYVGDGYDLRALPEAVVALDVAGIDVVSLANNHALDAGAVGLAQTLTALDAVGIAGLVGWETGELVDWETGRLVDRVPSPIHQSTHLPAYRFLAFDDTVAPLDLRAAADVVAAAAERADWVVVSIHWGGEYHAAPTSRQQAIARELTVAGASLIVGHGPHVLQRVERMGETLVAYSLGNFLFDQPYPADCRWGVVLRVTLRGDSVAAVEALPTVADRGRVRPAGPEDAAAILARLALEPAPNTQYRISNIEYRIPNNQYPLSDIQHPGAQTMNPFHAILLGTLQGATEFLPVSSSGHLVLVPWLLGWPAPGLAFGAVVHWGTALAVVTYFWRDWVSLLRAAFRFLRQLALRRSRVPLPVEQLSEDKGASVAGSLAAPSRVSDEARLAWFILLGTVPAALIGWLLEDFFEDMFARPAAAAAFLLVTAALLTASERLGRRERGLDTLTWLDASLVGLAQALAIFPGISRSGATIAAGLRRGLRREPAARFSFLLATPVILGAGLLKVVDLVHMGGLATLAPMLIVGFLSAAVVGFGCIHFLLRYLQRRRLYPFAVYCAAMGVACLVVALMRGT